MNEPPIRTSASDKTFAGRIGTKSGRKLKARQRGNRDVWSGLGVMGLIGWSIAVPTVAGAAIGLWVDRHYPGRHTWTLALLVAGLVIGCLNAARWVAAQDKAMQDDHDE